FLLGIYTHRQNIEYIRKIPRYWALTILVIFFLIIYLFIESNLHIITSGAFSYYHFSAPLQGLIFRVVYLLIALFMSFVVINIVPDNKKLAKMGENVIGFYLFHSVFIMIFQYLFMKIGFKPD